MVVDIPPAAFPVPPAGSSEAAGRLPRRVPVPVLRPGLRLCKPTGVQLGQGSRVALAADRGGVGEALAERLRRLGVQVLSLDADADREVVVSQVDAWRDAGAVHGVYWLAALDDEGPIMAMDADSWRAGLRSRAKNLADALRRLYDDGPFLVAGTRLGGRHGYDRLGALCPLGGAVTGCAKAYKGERADAMVKAVDFAAGGEPAVLADRLIEETLFDPGCVEVGRDGTLRWAIGLHELPAADGRPGIRLTGETVYLVTGAAGSIVSAVIADLAAHGGGGIFHLLDLTPAPDPADADLHAFLTSRDGMKADLIARAKAAGQKATPVTIEKELARIERRATAAAAIAAVRAAGGRASYHSVDVTDAAAVTALVREVVAAHGRIDVLVHAAGLQNSRRLPDKPPDEHDLVFDVKADGWFHLMRAIGGLPVGATVAFSSVAGRFGQLGQTDYTAANDLLCKLTSNLRRTRPDVRGIALDWSPWAGMGMATRGSIPSQMAAMGIDMLTPEAGIATVRRELTAGGTRGEVVVGGALGIMTTEFDRTGGLDVDRIALPALGPFAGRVTGMGIWSGLTVEVTVDPAALDATALNPAALNPAALNPAALNPPALNPAALNPAALNPAALNPPVDEPSPRGALVAGTVALPAGAVAALFAQVSRLPVPHRHSASAGPHAPSATVIDIDVGAPIRVDAGERTSLTIRVTLTPAEDAEQALVAHCELASTRWLPDRPDLHVVHATGRVRLAET